MKTKSSPKIPWVKTPTGGIRYQLNDVLEWVEAPPGFTFSGFAQLVRKLQFLDARQKRELVKAVDAAFRPQKVATNTRLAGR